MTLCLGLWPAMEPAFALDPPLVRLAETPALSAEQRLAAQSFLDEAVAKLPPQMKTRMGAVAPVTVSFEKLKGHEKLESEMLCLDTLTGDIEKAGVALGRTGRSSSRIQLSAHFLSARIASPKPGCRESLSRRHALAVTVHELSHVYDEMGFQDTGAQAEARACRNRARELKGGAFLNLARVLGRACERALSRRQSVSDDPQFLSLAQFDGARSRRRTEKGRTVPLMLESPREYFAYQMERYVLDPEFPCRLPAHAHYLRQHFGLPEVALACTPFQTAYLSDGVLTPTAMSKDRIYAVHYLFAGKGEKLMSRWGHAMFRLINCAPAHEEPLTGRKAKATPLGPDCERDEPFHTVVSFRANVDDIIVDTWGGMFGKYDSQEYLLGFNDVLSEYGKEEFRELLSVPLVLSDDEKTFMIEKSLENYWDYRGAYRFLTNNCATESLNLLQAVDPAIPLGAESVLTPRALLAAINQLSDGLGARISKRPAEYEDRRLYFPSAAAALLRMSEGLLPAMDSDGLKKYLEPTAYASRRARYQAQITEFDRAASDTERLRSAHKLMRTASLFSQLEEQSKIFLFVENKKKLYRRLEEIDESAPGTQSEIEEKVRELITAGKANALPLLVSPRYGVPLPQEVHADMLRKARVESRRILNGFDQAEARLFPDEAKLREVLTAHERFFQAEANRWTEIRDSAATRLIANWSVTDPDLSRLRERLTAVDPDLGSADVFSDEWIKRAGRPGLLPSSAP